MLYEVHITVDSDEVERWASNCTELGIKPLQIQLTTGEVPLQLMCAATFQGEHTAALEWVAGLETGVRAGGFALLRTKLECPLDKSRSFRHPSYYECHMKLMLRAEQVELVPAICRAADVHASQNLLASGVKAEKWYLTRRMYASDLSSASAVFNRSFAVASTLLPMVRMEMECVVYDTNPDLDRGWAGS